MVTTVSGFIEQVGSIITKYDYPQAHGLGPAVLRALPKLPRGRALSHHKQEAGCIYVNNAGPWNAIMHLDCTVPKDRLRLVLVLTTTLSLVLTFFG